MLQHLTYDTTRAGCMLGSLARGDPGRRFFCGDEGLLVSKREIPRRRTG